MSFMDNTRAKSSLVMSLFAVIAIVALASCTSSKTPYVSDTREPKDLPPSPRYSVVLMALRDELPRHADIGAFYLCQGPEQVATLQRKMEAPERRI
ncbi:MAG: hypothetical protein R3F13_09585 [Prosthecobacter sp.]